MNADYFSAEVHMLRSIEYSLRLLCWMKTEDGPKNRNRPEPLVLVEEKPEKLEYQPMSMDEMDQFLGWSPRQKAG